MRASRFKIIAVGSLATVLGLGVGLLTTQRSSLAQQQSDKGKGKGGAPAPVPPVLQNYSPVTAERLKNPEAGNWLMIRRTYNGWGYSPLDQINTANVSKLRLVWSTITGESRVHEAAPLVNNGAMFLSTPTGQVIAFDATTGDILWRYRKPRPEGAVILHDVSRGVALYGDRVYYAAAEAELVALDAKTGRPVWTTTVADAKAAYYITLAPLIADGKVMVGCSGGETGIRGFIAAYDPDTGKELWRTYTVPAPGTNKRAEFCPGSHGGKNWPPIAYSPQTRMIYIPANENVCGAIMGEEEVTYVAGRGYTGTARGGPPAQPQATDHFGEVQAWNVDTGQKVWTHKFEKSPNWGAMLATAGGLVISGGTNDRLVRAFDAKDGKLLWEFPTSSGVEAPVTTYVVDGRQYIAVLSGWGGDANGMNGTIQRTVSGVRSVPEGGSVWVFALE